MSRVFVISDNHFHQGSMIWFGKRPFRGVDEMNRVMLESWNSVVRDEDWVIVVGDFVFGSREKIQAVVEKLNGKKVLVRGNHDTKRRQSVLLGDLHIAVLKSISLDVEGLMLLFTHKPCKRGFFDFNVHGHHHRKLRSGKLDWGKYYNAAVEFNEYRPQLLRAVLEKKGIVWEKCRYREIIEQLEKGLIKG